MCFKTGALGIKIVKCPPDDKPVVVYKNPGRAFANETKETRQVFNANVKGLNELLAAGGLTAEDQQKLIAFKDRMDKYNIDVLNAYKTLFLTFNARPCDDDTRQQLDEMQSKIYELTRDLRKMEFQLAKLSAMKKTDPALLSADNIDRAASTAERLLR